jgi:hypothetical protein
VENLHVRLRVHEVIPSCAPSPDMLAIWHDPAELDTAQNSGGLREGFIDVPLIVVALGVVLGTAGALLGKGLAAAFGSRSTP